MSNKGIVNCPKIKLNLTTIMIKIISELTGEEAKI